MSNDSQQQIKPPQNGGKPAMPTPPAPPRDAQSADGPRGIPVKWLVFDRQGGHDLFTPALAPPSLRNGIKKLVAGTTTDKADVTITYMPHLRHHRVTMNGNRGQPAETVMVPEHWCFWCPEEQ